MTLNFTEKNKQKLLQKLFPNLFLIRTSSVERSRPDDAAAQHLERQRAAAEACLQHENSTETVLCSCAPAAFCDMLPLATHAAGRRTYPPAFVPGLQARVLR
jgi:hypothetical protein